MGDNEQYSKEVLICRLSLSLVTRDCFHTLLHNIGEAFHYSCFFFLKGYAHVPAWSQECRCATLLTFTYRLLFEVLCLGLSNPPAPTAIGTLEAARVSKTSSRVPRTKESVCERKRCCASAFVMVVLPHVRGLFNSTHCTTYQEVSCVRLHLP